MLFSTSPKPSTPPLKQVMGDGSTREHQETSSSEDHGTVSSQAASGKIWYTVQFWVMEGGGGGGECTQPP